MNVSVQFSGEQGLETPPCRDARAITFYQSLGYIPAIAHSVAEHALGVWLRMNDRYLS